MSTASASALLLRFSPTSPAIKTHSFSSINAPRIRRLPFSGRDRRSTPIFSSSGETSFGSNPSRDGESSFCIIEGPETVDDFVQMQLQDIQENIRSRRNKIFLLMEEVRRLRIQQRIKNAQFIDESSDENEMPDIPSSIPFLPHVLKNADNRKSDWTSSGYKQKSSLAYGANVYFAIPQETAFLYCSEGKAVYMDTPPWTTPLELRLGVGGTSYEDFIRSMHLPLQLSQVDPIVASFSGGAVGVISALMLVESMNVEQQEKKRCKYCNGTEKFRAKVHDMQSFECILIVGNEKRRQIVGNKNLYDVNGMDDQVARKLMKIGDDYGKFRQQQ
ncbi:hypothetical protein ACLOJK_005883 [Asimina triloba]